MTWFCVQILSNRMCYFEVNFEENRDLFLFFCADFNLLELIFLTFDNLIQ